MASFLELILEPKLQAYYRFQEIKSQWKILELAERGKRPPVNSGLNKLRVKSKAPVKAGKEKGVKVPRMVMVSDQPWPRVMRRLPVRGRRSVDRGRAGPAIELRNHLIRVADLVTWWGRQNGTSR